MLKFFFNKESKVVYTMEVLGLVCLILLLTIWWPGGKNFWPQLAFYLFILEYAFIRICAMAKWYDKDGRNTFILTKPYKRDTKYEGIELQFKKALVPTSYIMAVFGGLLIAGAPAFVLYIGDFLLAVIAHVNVILIYFHIKDNEPLPVNHFTHNKHLR